MVLCYNKDMKIEKENIANKSTELSPDAGPSSIESMQLEVDILCKKLEEEHNPEKFKELMPLFLKGIEDLFKNKLTEQVTPIYKKMQDEKLILRVENMSRVIQSFKNHEGYVIGNKGDHRANCVIPENEGIKLAFAEGFAPGPVRLLIGYDVRTAIAFSPEKVLVTAIDDLEIETRDAKVRKNLCRHIEGTIEPEHIKSVILRVLKKFFQESRMTEQEINSNTFYIIRGIEIYNK